MTFRYAAGFLNGQNVMAERAKFFDHRQRKVFME